MRKATAGMTAAELCTWKLITSTMTNIPTQSIQIMHGEWRQKKTINNVYTIYMR